MPQVVVKKGCYMPLENGTGVIGPGESASVSDAYLEKVSYLIEQPEAPKAKK